jgi:Transposase zinc-ribbon domain
LKSLSAPTSSACRRSNALLPAFGRICGFQQSRKRQLGILSDDETFFLRPALLRLSRLGHGPNHGRVREVPRPGTVPMIKNTSPILAALKDAAVSEPLAVASLEQQRWGDARACQRCGVADVYQMKDANGARNKDYRWRCKGCKQMFTVRTGTIFEETRLQLRVWVFAFWRACASKKGISAAACA